MSASDAVAGVIATVGNLIAWIAHTEQIWFPMAAVYVNDLSAAFGLPDLRGPFLALTLLYVGFRLGDFVDKRDEIESNL